MAYIPGKGAKLQLSIASVFTDIAQVLNITPPSATMGTTETTHLASTAREFISNIFDGGEVQLTIEWDSGTTTHNTLWTKFKAGALEAWKIILPDVGNDEFSFNGIITGFAFDEIVIDGVVTASITIKISGDVTQTP